MLLPFLCIFLTQLTRYSVVPDILHGPEGSTGMRNYLSGYSTTI